MGIDGMMSLSASDMRPLTYPDDRIDHVTNIPRPATVGVLVLDAPTPKRGDGERRRPRNRAGLAAKRGRHMSRTTSCRSAGKPSPT